MSDYVNSIEECVNSYLDIKGYESVEFEEDKYFYYNEDDENNKSLFIYDIYNENEKNIFNNLIKSLEELNTLNRENFEKVDFLIIVESIQQKHSLPKDKMIQEKIKQIMNLCKINIKRDFEVSYEFVAITKSIQTYDIKIKERYRATEANPLCNPETNGLVFTANLFDIVNLYNKIGDSLFKENLRIGLENKQDFLEVTPEILKTLKNNPEEFWFLNNGITIIADKQSLNLSSNNVLQLKDLYDAVKMKKWKISVINGAQTISAASKFFFEDSKLKDYKFLQGLSKDDSALKNFVEELIKESPKDLNKCNKDLTEDLRSFIKLRKEKSVEDVREFIRSFLEEKKIKDNFNLMSEKLLSHFFPNQLSLDKAKNQADVLLRVIYYNSLNQNESAKITNKITVALNRQKPMRMEDIALASQFVQNINHYYAFEMQDSFSIIRRGEAETPDFNHYSLETIVKMLNIIAKKNPGKFGSSKLSKELQEEEKKDGLTIFKGESVFEGIFNKESILEESRNQEEAGSKGEAGSEEEADETIKCPSKFQNFFEQRYSFINSAVKTKYLIDENLKTIKKEVKKLSMPSSSLSQQLMIKGELTSAQFNSLKAMVLYGSDYILACWFYQCCLYTLDDKSKKEEFIKEITKNVHEKEATPINFDKIGYSNSIFEGELKIRKGRNNEKEKENYRKLFYRFLIEISNRWMQSTFAKEEVKLNKNGFKSTDSYKFVDEFLQSDLCRESPSYLLERLNDNINHTIDGSNQKGLVEV